MERWEENDSYIPNPGDVIYYDWQDSGEGDNQGVPDHVGIVESVSEGSVVAIEGNKNDSVDRRYITVGSRYIRGYGLPDFAWWAKKNTPVEKEKPWYIKNGEWEEAQKIGITDGTRPDDKITRAECASMILRAVKYVIEYMTSLVNKLLEAKKK